MRYLKIEETKIFKLINLLIKENKFYIKVNNLTHITFIKKK
jgi:hypothetical protein